MEKSVKEFPFNVTKAKGKAFEKYAVDFQALYEGVVEIGPEKFIMPIEFKIFAEQLYNFEARPDDVYICTLPRSGTTWNQEIIWLICNNLDYETACETPLIKRFPFLEMHAAVNSTFKDACRNFDSNNKTMSLYKWVTEPPYDRFAADTGRRFIKTHLPIKLLPHNLLSSGAKIVYVARNPKDMLVSYYHYSKTKLFYDFKGDFDTFLQYFLDDMLLWCPYWKHILDGWSNRHRENVHFLFYEEMKLDQSNCLKKLAQFLGHPLNDEDLPKLMDHISYETIKKNANVNLKFDVTESSPQDFVRRGEVGGNPEITDEISKRIDEWIELNTKGTDFKFPYTV